MIIWIVNFLFINDNLTIINLRLVLKMKTIIKDNKRVFFKGEIPEKYFTSTYMEVNKEIKAVFLPINKEEVSEIVKYCYENDVVFLVRGAGTGAVGGQNTILNDEVVIDLSLMNKMISFDNKSLTLTVEPGVTLGEVRDFAASKGYFYPPDPGAKNSTIGGNVSTNAGGMRAVKYGTTRDYVKEIEVVLPTGEITSFGSLNIKDVSGYNLKDLFIGSEGTLGIITKIKLKLIKKSEYQKSLILVFDNILEASKTVLNILNNGLKPTAIELFDNETIEYSERFLKERFPSSKGSAYILTTFDSHDKEMVDKVTNVIKNNYKEGTKEIKILNEKEEKTAWLLRDNILYALMQFTQYEMLDEVVPLEEFATMIAYTRKLAIKYNLTILNFGHAGDGNIHTLLLKEGMSDKEWEIKKTSVLDEIYQEVYQLKGLISAEHGVGYTKRAYFLKHTDPTKITVMRKIKKALDPKNLLNPNKVI